MPDAERYTAILSDARRWLKAEAGVEVDPDDPSLLSAAIALQALRMQEGRFEEVSARAVERASDPLRENMQKQIGILQNIAGHFEDASTESRHINDARKMLFDAINAMDADIKPLHSSMMLTREALDKQRKEARSPLLFMLIGAGFTAVGIALGLLIGTQIL